jgi:hypothetical protein
MHADQPFLQKAGIHMGSRTRQNVVHDQTLIDA